MSKMTYKGYNARIEYSEDDNCFVGHVAGINDVIGFHADSVEELKTAFAEAVNDYLETCTQLGRNPQKPYSGKLLLRMEPELHAKLAMEAELRGISLNQWANEKLVAEPKV